MASEVGGTAASAGGGEGYGVLMISDALGATEVIALEKVRPVGQRLVAFGDIKLFLLECVLTLLPITGKSRTKALRPFSNDQPAKKTTTLDVSKQRVGGGRSKIS